MRDICSVKNEGGLLPQTNLDTLKSVCYRVFPLVGLSLGGADDRRKKEALH